MLARKAQAKKDCEVRPSKTLTEERSQAKATTERKLVVSSITGYWELTEAHLTFWGTQRELLLGAVNTGPAVHSLFLVRSL